MRGRIPLFVLLASAFTFLASLFLPWRESLAPPLGDSALGVLSPVDGWITGTGDVAVLLVVALVVACVVGLLRPQLVARLPLGSLGVALTYFAAAVAVELHSMGAAFGALRHTGWSYGFYVGLASAAVAGLCGLAWSSSELRWPQGTLDAVAAILAITLLVSFLLPWIGVTEPNPRRSAGIASASYPGIVSAAGALVALALLLVAPLLRGKARRPWRLPFAIATAILTGAAASVNWYVGSHRAGTWLGIGCAVSLVALEAVRAWPFRLPAVPRGPTAVRVGASALLVVSLFLPWEELRGGPAINGWSSMIGAAAGGLCLLLLATPVVPALERYVLDAVIAGVLLVSALAATVRADQIALHVGYGAFVGIAAAGILLVSALVYLRPTPVDRRRALARAVPLTASILCVAAVVLPWWFVLPQAWSFQDAALYGWLSVPGLLLGLYLVRLWTSRVRGPATPDHQLVLVPGVLLTLASLELIRFRDTGVIWSAVILVGLCVLLIVLGWIEEDRGLEGFRIPEEIWRIDRLPGAES